MHILLVSEDIPYPNMGGLAKHVLTLARALVKAGHKVDLLGGDQYPIEAAGEEGLFGGKFFGELHGHLSGWKENKLGVFLPPKRPWIARIMAQCIMVRADNYDVIHYHGHYPNIAKYIPRHINFVQTRHDQGGDCLTHTRFRDGEICNRLNPADCAGCMASQPNALQRAISTFAVRSYRLDVAEAFRRHKTLFVSDMLRRNFSRVAGNSEWGIVLHNFVDLDKLRFVLAHNPITEGANRQSIQLFFAGTLFPHKGIDALLQRLVPVMPKNMSLAIAGSSPLESSLREQYEGERVTFHGWRSPDEVLQFAATADIVLVPSVWEEPCATTVFEGLLLGKPTFALERGGTPELKIYERYPGQLHLHKDMDSLVAELIHFQPQHIACDELDERGGVDQAVRHLLEIYQLSSVQN